jgi:hypothetical protein
MPTETELRSSRWLESRITGRRSPSSKDPGRLRTADGYDRRDDARAGAPACDPLPRPGARVRLQGQGVLAGARRRALHPGRRTRRAGRRGHAHRHRRHRIVDGRRDRRCARRPRPRLPLEDRGGVEGADHTGGTGVPRCTARRLPPALHVERRRRADRGDGGDSDRDRPRVHGADRPLGSAHDRPRVERGAPRPAARPDRRRQCRHRGGRARLPDPVGHGGRHPRGRITRPVRRHARGSTSSLRACIRSSAWTASR